MKTPQLTSLIFILSILGFGRALSATAIPPQVQSEIAWLSAEELALRGEAAIAELPQGDRLAAEGMLRSAAVLPAEDPEACDVVGKPSGLNEPVDAASKLQRDRYAFLGRITEAEQGLAHGTPATIFTIEVERLLKWPDQEPRSWAVYLLHHQGQVVVSGKRLCSEGRRFPAAPKIGKEILILTDSVVPTDPLLILAPNSDLFFETSEGKASVPGSSHLEDLLPWDRFRDHLLGGEIER